MDWSRIDSCSYVAASYQKMPVMEENNFETLYFMNQHLSETKLKELVSVLLGTPSLGHIIRVKGFMPLNEGWIELNATRDGIDLRPIGIGQEILIVIGEGLNEPAIKALFST